MILTVRSLRVPPQRDEAILPSYQKIPTFTPMKELLLLLCRYPYDESNRETLAKLLSEINNREVFVRLVNDHGIIALAAYNIKKARLEELVAAKAMAILENGLMRSVVRNAWLAERWKEVNEILSNAGIKHILLKGMALEHTIYGARGLRQMTDNDILIRREEAMDAWHLLQENEFELITPKSSLHLKIITEFGQHLPALFKDGYAIEIHKILFDETDDDDESYNRLFSDSVEIAIGKEKAYILPEDIHLKYLIKHHTRHELAGECQLRTYTDIKLIDPENSLSFPESFILHPDQSRQPRYRRLHYRATVNSVSKGNRFMFITGDIFPSLRWMKRRYGCSTIVAIMKYPQRIGKLLWLI